MKPLLIIAIILTTSWTAYSQATETKVVKVSVLKAMGKDLEKCKLTKKAFDLKTAINDSLILQNIQYFKDLEEQRLEQEKLDKRIDELNKENLKLVKQKKSGWIVPVLVGLGGVVIGVSL